MVLYWALYLSRKYHVPTLLIYRPENTNVVKYDVYLLPFK